MHMLFDVFKTWLLFPPIKRSDYDLLLTRNSWVMIYLFFLHLLLMNALILLYSYFFSNKIIIYSLDIFWFVFDTKVLSVDPFFFVNLSLSVVLVFLVIFNLNRDKHSFSVRFSQLSTKMLQMLITRLWFISNLLVLRCLKATLYLLEIEITNLKQTKVYMLQCLP